MTTAARPVRPAAPPRVHVMPEHHSRPWGGSDVFDEDDIVLLEDDAGRRAPLASEHGWAHPDQTRTRTDVQEPLDRSVVDGLVDDLGDRDTVRAVAEVYLTQLPARLGELRPAGPATPIRAGGWPTA